MFEVGEHRRQHLLFFLRLTQDGDQSGGRAPGPDDPAAAGRQSALAGPRPGDATTGGDATGGRGDPRYIAVAFAWPPFLKLPRIIM